MNGNLIRRWLVFEATCGSLTLVPGSVNCICHMKLESVNVSFLKCLCSSNAEGVKS